MEILSALLSLPLAQVGEDAARLLGAGIAIGLGLIGPGIGIGILGRRRHERHRPQPGGHRQHPDQHDSRHRLR